MRLMRWFISLLFVDVCVARMAPEYNKHGLGSISRKLSIPTPVHEFDFRSCTDGSNISDTYSSLKATPGAGSTCLSNGVVLNGVSDFVLIEAFSLTRSFTVEMVFNLASLTPHATLMDFHDTDGSNSLSIRLNGVSTGLITTVVDLYGNKINTTSSNGLISNNGWTHVIWSVNGAFHNQTLYVEGIEVARGGYNMSSQLHEVYSLGGGSEIYLETCCSFNTTKSEGMLDGTIALYRFYDHALTQSQVSSLQEDALYLPSPMPTQLPSASPTSLPSPLPTSLPTSSPPTLLPTSTPTSSPSLWRGELDDTTLDNSVTYLIATTSGVTQGFTVSGDGILSGVSEVDDTPMYHVKQQFTFPYGGVRYRHAWINANGGIFFTPNPPCSVYYSTGDSCTFDTEPTSSVAGWVNMLAVFVTDLNPADSSTSQIKYWTTEDDFVVQWGNLSLFGSAWFGYTFSAQIRSSGHIRVYLESVLSPELVSDGPSWTSTDENSLVGLRFDSTQLARTLISSQQTINRATWLDGDGSSGDGVDGVYTDRDSTINSNTMIDYCPVPTKLCMMPSSLNTTGITGQSESTLLNLTAASWGCDSDVFNFRCVFDTSTTSVTASATLVEAETGISLQCYAPSLDIGVYEVSLQYNHVNAATWNNMDDTVIGDLTVLDGLSIEACSATEVCDSCGVCGGTSGCIGCDGNTILAERDCAYVCDGAGSSHTDTTGSCCDSVNGSDCLGICGGSFEEGWNNVNRAYRVCCFDVDCSGICGGSAEWDSCNICSGGDTGHVANSDVDCLGVCYGNVTCAPTPAIYPTKQPTNRPSHAPTVFPTHPPTLSPLNLAVITSAVVIGDVSASEWNAETGDRPTDSVLASVLLQNIALLTDTSEVVDINVSYYDTSRRRLTESDSSSYMRSLVTSSDGVLCIFTLEIYFLLTDEFFNASSIFKDIEKDLTFSIQSGNFSTDLSKQALAASSSTTLLLNGTVSETASLNAMSKYGKFYQTTIYRRPTPSPSSSPLPTHVPTRIENTNDDPTSNNDDGDGDDGSYEGPNKWLIVVIVIEVVISVALCFCCVKVGRRTAEDPLDLGQLAAQQRRDLLEGSVDATLFLARPGQLRDQYQSAVRQLPTLEWEPNIEHKGTYLDDNCAICLTKYEDDDDKLLRVMNCGHGFHKACLDEWLTRRNLCPLCKRVAIANLDARLNNQANPLSTETHVRTGWYSRLFPRRVANDVNAAVVSGGGEGDVEMSIASTPQSSITVIDRGLNSTSGRRSSLDQPTPSSQTISEETTVVLDGGGGAAEEEDISSPREEDGNISEDEEEIHLSRKREKKEKKRERKEKKERKKEKKEKKKEKKDREEQSELEVELEVELEDVEDVEDVGDVASNEVALNEFRQKLKEENDQETINSDVAIDGGGGGRNFENENTTP